MLFIVINIIAPLTVKLQILLFIRVFCPLLATTEKTQLVD